ncbi:MAG TPA: AgmX/PglI C-terminal domain-containing protein [Nannocystaceae bacterium]|nr:AgmX/PglI C-terminal domain-containing protein [Nannocystaceae bacterium]
MSSSPLRNFALPLFSLLGIVAYWIWRSSVSTAAADAQPAETKAATQPQKTTQRGDSSSAPAAKAEPTPAATKPSASTTAEDVRRTRRDRAASDALRLALRERTGGGASKRSGAAGTQEPAPPPTLDKDYIQARIKEDLVPIAKECYESALEDDPKLGGKLVMKFSIVGDEDVGGVVDEADVDPSSEIKHDALRECMRESMLSLAFAPPEDGGTVQVTYPFVFAAEDE